MTTYINGTAYSDLDDLIAKSGLSELELQEIKLNAQILGQFIEARNNSGMTQKQLEILSGIKQPQISRIEKGITQPQVSTILKLLQPLGMTLAVVPTKSNNTVNRKK